MVVRVKWQGYWLMKVVVVRVVLNQVGSMGYGWLELVVIPSW